MDYDALPVDAMYVLTPSVAQHRSADASTLVYEPPYTIDRKNIWHVEAIKGAGEIQTIKQLMPEVAAHSHALSVNVNQALSAPASLAHLSSSADDAMLNMNMQQTMASQYSQGVAQDTLPNTAPVSTAGQVYIADAGPITLPDHIPAPCVVQASSQYSIPMITLLAVLKVESGGKLGVVRKNSNGTHDIGPAQLNTGAWGNYFYRQYGISANTMAYDMCTSLKLMGYALRTLINRAGGDYWRGVGNYHSNTPSKHWRYVYTVHQAQQRIISSKAF